MKLLFLTNIPSPYRTNFFNELGKLCELTVLFEKGASDERDKSWKEYSFDNFKGVILKGRSSGTDRAICPEVVSWIKKTEYDNIIVSNVSTPTGMLALQYLKLKKIPYYIEGDGGFAKSGKGFKERIKKHFIKGAKGYFSTSEEHDKYYKTYGAEENKIYRYPFTSLYESDIEATPAGEEEKQRLREKLGIREKKIVITVGQLIRRKGMDLLIEATGSLGDDVGVYIVGGKPTEELLSLAEKFGPEKIHFVDFMLKPQLKEYYRAADVFVLPTREDVWGLVINEAMASGLPVVTTSRCIAGLELVSCGKNGYIVPVESVEELAKRINEILADEKMRWEMACHSISTVKEYTFEKMAKTHIDIIEKSGE